MVVIVIAAMLLCFLRGSHRASRSALAGVLLRLRRDNGGRAGELGQVQWIREEVYVRDGTITAVIVLSRLDLFSHMLSTKDRVSAPRMWSVRRQLRQSVCRSLDCSINISPS